MEFGIVSFGSALGERVPVADVVNEYTQDTERVLDYGYRGIHRCTPEVGLTDLAADAARDALRTAEIDAQDLDLLVLAITDIPEYLYWDVAAHLQHVLGADRAEAVLIAQGCVGGITCFDQVAGRFATHPDHRTALMVGVNRTCEAYWNRMDTHSLLFSDGAAAAVAVRDHPSCQWGATEVMTDGRFASFFRMDDGGAANPFTSGVDKPHVRDAWDMMEYFDYDPDRFGEFVDLMNSRVHEVTTRACRRAGVGEPDRLILFHDNARTFAAVAEKFGITTDRTNVEISLRDGHFGAADHLLSLSGHLDAGEFASGDVVALAGMGRGMHWACTVVRI
ncbi:3-oxoacyl-ACP synthase III family protein [Actinocrispum wychmicini]|uniref:3-oxoacyl-[acyl-carrier-protein] synthase-3 n=1 Tax=Actinocrispum wychmicini TaxID=1213861 RepID=A0A4R2IMN3_9PSEU|nr:3-oxoacyl-[acyl-carrier-protein] synthase III C-terminal domain-containing protein [Actinocrispum wychmicini]TCO45239.1 3-oxoacyl-[acyl-carrier-protein] synthase-3 [Actinocrispum wychmicini]